MADTQVDPAADGVLHYRSVRAGPVWIDEDTAYIFFIDNTADVEYRKTINGGANWGAQVSIRAGTVSKLSIWYDKWTPGDTGTTIHIAYLDTDVDDVFYRDLDTFDDSLGAEVTVFAGVSFDPGNWSLSVVDITKARGGNLYIGFWGDNDGEFGFYRSINNGANWTSRAQLADGNLVDGILLMPGDEADNQDIWCIYWDRSANALSLKIYDNSGNSWGETAIAGVMADDALYYQMSAAPRHSDNHVILAAWSALAVATADLKVWDIGGAASITAKTNVVTNLGASAGVAVFINQQNDDIYVAYLKGGAWLATVDAVYKKSADGGANWGAEQAYSEAAADDLRAVWAGISAGDDGGKFQPVWYNDDNLDLFVNLVNDVDIAAAVGIGVDEMMAAISGGGGGGGGGSGDIMAHSRKPPESIAY